MYVYMHTDITIYWAQCSDKRLAAKHENSSSNLITSTLHWYNKHQLTSIPTVLPQFYEEKKN